MPYPLRYLLLACPVAGVLSPAPAAPLLRPVSLPDLCVTNGALTALPSGHLGIETPSSRAVLRAMTEPVAEIRFRYGGPSAGDKPLASGELRRQIGLKLRAQDGCNLLYVMWRIAPEARLVVSVKENPGQHASRECGAHGYSTMKPRSYAPLPVLRVGEWHVLRAELSGRGLVVTADGHLAWEGDVAASVEHLDGPVGLRSDNGLFEVEYLAGAAEDRPPRFPPAHCAEPGEKLTFDLE